MRKQYDYYEITPFKYEIVLYHDGIKVVTEKISESYILEFLKDLKAQGYTQGYLKEDVEQAQYEDMMENALHFSKLSDELIDRVSEIKYRYTSSLMKIGIDTTNKDLLEVIADLADALNRTMCDLHDLGAEFYNFKYNVEKELNK